MSAENYEWISEGWIVKKYLFHALFVSAIFLFPRHALSGEASAVRLKISDFPGDGKIIVDAINDSNFPIRIWRDTNSWGYKGWRIIRLKDDGKSIEFFYRTPGEYFTRNFASFHVIESGEKKEILLNLNDGRWCVSAERELASNSCENTRVDFQSGDVVAVVYDISPTREATALSVWHGVAITKAIKP